MKFLMTLAAIFLLMPLSVSAEKMEGRPFPWNCPCWNSTAEYVGMNDASFLIDDCVETEYWSLTAARPGMDINYSVSEPMGGDCFRNHLIYDREEAKFSSCYIAVGVSGDYPACVYYSSKGIHELTDEESHACKAAFLELRTRIKYVDECN